MKPIQLRCPNCNRFLGTTKAATVDVKLKCGNCGAYERQKLQRLTLAHQSNTSSTTRAKLAADSKPQEGTTPQTRLGDAN